MPKGALTHGPSFAGYLLWALLFLAPSCAPSPKSVPQPAPKPAEAPQHAPLSPPPTAYRPTLVKVADPGPWSLVDADMRYSCATKTDGTLWCWGENHSGKLGDGTTLNRALPQHVQQDSRWLAFAMADHLTCAVRDDFTLWCWGEHKQGLPSHNSPVVTPELVPVKPDPGPLCATMPPLSAPQIRHVGLGDNHACVLSREGSVFCNGDTQRAGALRPLGCQAWGPIDTSRLGPRVSVAQLALGSKHSCIVTDEGLAACWGLNDRGQVGVGSPQETVPLPTPVDTSALKPPAAIRQLATGTFHSCALLGDNTPVCWGNNGGGALGTNDTNDRRAPTPMQLPPELNHTTWTQIDGGYQSTCLLSDKGNIYCWGIYLCQPSESLSTSCGPVGISGPDIDGAPAYTQLAMGCSHGCALNVQHELYCWGMNHGGELGDGTLPPPVSDAEAR